MVKVCSLDSVEKFLYVLAHHRHVECMSFQDELHNRPVAVFQH